MMLSETSANHKLAEQCKGPCQKHKAAHQKEQHKKDSAEQQTGETLEDWREQQPDLQLGNDSTLHIVGKLDEEGKDL